MQTDTRALMAIRPDAQTSIHCRCLFWRLAISRALIELMGGSFLVSSEGEGCGTTVTLRLPLVRLPSSRSGDSLIAVPRH